MKLDQKPMHPAVVVVAVTVVAEAVDLTAEAITTINPNRYCDKEPWFTGAFFYKPYF